MAWGKNKPDDPPQPSVPVTQPQTSSVPRQPLNKDLQKLVDHEDDLWDHLYEGDLADSTSTPVRYFAYTNRLRTILLSAHRYVAYTSDIGESFRPVAHPYLVRSAYAISWGYLIGDVGHEGYKAYCRNRKIRAPSTEAYRDATGMAAPEGSEAAAMLKEGGHVPAIEDYRAVMAQRAIFQGLASMGLPALTIHSVVKYSGKALKSSKNATMRTWGPIGLGLAVVPALPYIFDEPVEKAVHASFHAAFRAVGGEGAVGSDSHGASALEKKKEM
ncbi:MAG: hypothetical protein Q9160_004193 [Pyrenula sp. 1 TL-2023]